MFCPPHPFSKHYHNRLFLLGVLRPHGTWNYKVRSRSTQWASPDLQQVCRRGRGWELQENLAREMSERKREGSRWAALTAESRSAVPTDLHPRIHFRQKA